MITGPELLTIFGTAPAFAYIAASAARQFIAERRNRLSAAETPKPAYEVADDLTRPLADVVRFAEVEAEDEVFYHTESVIVRTPAAVPRELSVASDNVVPIRNNSHDGEAKFVAWTEDPATINAINKAWNERKIK